MKTWRWYYVSIFDLQGNSVLWEGNCTGFVSACKSAHLWALNEGIEIDRIMIDSVEIPKSGPITRTRKRVS